MSNKEDYSKEEWLLLHRAPGLVGAAVLVADESGFWGTTKETFMLSKEWAKGVANYPYNALIQALLQEKTDPEGNPIKEAYKDFKEELKRKGMDQFIVDVVDDCGKAANILATKSDQQEASEYKAWVMTVGRKVAMAAKEKDSGDDKVSSQEAALLEKIAQALGHELAA